MPPPKFTIVRTPRAFARRRGTGRSGAGASDAASHRRVSRETREDPARNISRVVQRPANQLNVYDVLRAHKIVVTKSALGKIEAQYGASE